MRFRHLATFLWIAAFLLAGELALELRARARGWPTPLLGGGVQDAAPGAWGPAEGFPFRSRFVEPERARGVRRVWVASSSYGADAQLPAEQIFPTLLAERLSALGTPTQVLNASEDGLATADNAALLRALGARWKPDVVVLYQMSNDVDHICARLESGAETATVALGEASGGPGAVRRFVESTVVYQHLKTQVAARLAKGRRLRHALGPEGEELFAAAVHDFVEAARGTGAEPVLVTFATSHRGDQLASMPREYEYNLLRFNVVLSIYGWIDSIDRYNAVLEQVAREEGLRLVDLAGVMSGRSELFRDLWHMTPEGHRVAAETLAAALADTKSGGGSGT